MDAKELWVVIPVFNEKNIGLLISQIKAYTKNIIIVDDGSEKKYPYLDAILIEHHKNYGKGAALRTGCDYAFKEKKAKAVIIMDGDGQHDPKSIPEFLLCLDKHEVVFGSRSFEKPMSFYRRTTNKAISLVTYWLFKMKVSDALSGYKAMTKLGYLKTRWHTNRFNVEADIIINARRNNVRYCEIGISTIYTRPGNIHVSEGMKILFHILKRRFLDANITD